MLTGFKGGGVEGKAAVDFEHTHIINLDMKYDMPEDAPLINMCVLPAFLNDIFFP